MNFKLLLAVLITVAASPAINSGPLVCSSTDTAGSPIHKDELKSGDRKQPTSLLVHPGHPDNLASRVSQLEAEFREKIEEINTKTSRKSQQQEKEIKVLQTRLEEEKKFSKQLSGRISQLEASTNPSSMGNGNLLARPKRSPPHISPEKDREKIQQFYGPATNCEELGLIGYTLNGYYLVKKSTDSTKKEKIGMVYCQFQQPHRLKQIITSDVRTMLDLENSELEEQIMDRVSQKLLPVDSKVMEQTKQIKEIFGLLGKKHDDSLPMASKTDQIKLAGKTKEEIEAFKTTDRDQSMRINPLEQKLSNLQMTSLSLLSNRANTKDKNSLINPPSSCKDLLMLGHTFDGLFLVKNKRTKMIQTVFCQFLGDDQVVTSDLWSLPDLENFNWGNVPTKSSECTYKGGPNHEIICEQVSIKLIKEFFRKYYFTWAELLNSVELTLLSGSEWIPADFVDDKTKKIVIKYDNNQEPVTLLQIHRDAFRGTKDSAESLKMINFDSSQLDLGFLSGFNQLANLEFTKVHYMQHSLPTLPLLPKLTSLEFNNVSGLNYSTITFPKLSTSGLKSFKLYSGEHNDASVSRMLDWILLSSAKTLKFLDIRDIKITKVPFQIRSFTALEHLDLDGNAISTVRNGALSFSVPVSKLYLSSNIIKTIEPGAFQGNFGDADVNLDKNSITRFEESVFRPMLEQMVMGSGKIELGNSINCDIYEICHLAWVIRDFKLRKKALGKCSNSTDLSELGSVYATITTREPPKRRSTKTPLKSLKLIKNGAFDHCPETTNKP